MVAKSERELMLDAQRIARQNSKASDWISIRDIAFYYALVIAACVLVIYTNFNWMICLLAAILIGKAQNGLLLSGHEAIHYSLFKNRKINDLVATYLCYAPLGVGFYRARAAHLDHHRYLLTERDEKLDQQILHPTRKRLVAHLIWPLLGSYVYKGVLRIYGLAPSRRAHPDYTLPKSAQRTDRISILIAGVVLVSIFALIDWRLILLWGVTLLTVSAFIHNATAFLDHARQADEGEGDYLYTYRVTWLDRLLFAVQQARHAEHHLFPQVPYHRLDRIEPIVHELPNVRYRRGYIATLCEIYANLGGDRSHDDKSPARIQELVN